MMECWRWMRSWLPRDAEKSEYWITAGKGIHDGFIICESLDVGETSLALTQELSRNEYTDVDWCRETRPNLFNNLMLLGYPSFNPAYTVKFSGNFLLRNPLKEPFAVQYSERSPGIARKRQG